MLRHAFKEWAVICKALASGRQMLIFRKGGVLDTEADFRVEHRSFWLFPTSVHQQATGVIPEAQMLLEQAREDRAPAEIVRLTCFAEVQEVHQVLDLDRVLALAGLHIWAEKIVRERFHYRRPGLTVLVVQVFKAAVMHELPNIAAYQGCRSWVQLERELPTDEATPVLDDSSIEQGIQTIHARLQMK
jgi:hypothetical protein